LDCVGFGFAALRIADPFWARATFSLAIITVSVALVGAYARNGKARMSWAGFATGGGASLVTWLSTVPIIGNLNGRPEPLLQALLLKFQPYISPMASGGAALIHYTQISNSLDVILLGFVGAVVAQVVAVKDDQANQHQLGQAEQDHSHE
jgi:hypothetical protein